jgi:predicted RNase H-like nuclease
MRRFSLHRCPPIPLGSSALAKMRTHERHELRTLGVDLAWTDETTANKTGVVAAEPDGTIVAAGWTTGVEETVAWANTHATVAAMLFVDAPLVVLNADKQRLCEKQVGQCYGRWKVSANSTNLGSPRLAGVRFKRELDACGWIYADGIAGPPRSGRVVSECYPYTTIVGTDELGYESERPLYKRKPKGLSAAAWRPVRARACDVLIQRVADLRNASPPLDLRSHPVTAQLLDERSPLDDRTYKRWPSHTRRGSRSTRTVICTGSARRAALLMQFRCIWPLGNTRAASRSPRQGGWCSQCHRLAGSSVCRRRRGSRSTARQNPRPGV